MSMNATIKAMFVKLMQTLPKLLPIIIRCVRKDTLGKDSHAKVPYFLFLLIRFIKPRCVKHQVGASRHRLGHHWRS